MKGRILFVMQLPPPYHGASLTNEHIASSQLLKDSFNISIIDIKTSADIYNIGKFSFSKILKMISHGFTLLFRLIFFKPKVVYFTLAPSGFAFYRDALYIILIKFFNKKLILHLHGKGFRSGIEKSKLFHFFARKIFNKSYCIHLSEKLQEDVPGHSLKKRFFIPNGLPVPEAALCPKEKNNIAELLTISNYVKTKGILDIIDSLEIVSQKNFPFHFSLVGKPYDLDVEYLNKYIADKNLSNFISVTGPKYGEEKYNALKKADFFLLPTYYKNEAFPIALLEALQFGLPCITTREGGIPDMIQDHVTGFFVSPGNKEEIAKNILLLLQDVQRREVMSKNAKQVFLEKYTLEKFEKNIANTINEVLAEK